MSFTRTFRTMAIGVGIFFALMSALSLGQGTEVFFEDFEPFESPESLAKTVAEFSSMYFTMVPISSQGVVFGEVLKSFLPPSELTSNIIDSTVKISLPLTNAVETLLAENSRKGIINKSTSFLKAAMNSISDEDRKLLRDLVSEENIKFLLPQAILELRQSPEFQSFYSDLKQTIKDNRNLYEMIPSSMLLKNVSLRNSDHIDFVELPDKEHSDHEDSKIMSETPSEGVKMVTQSKRLKRSIAKNEESLYSALMEAISSSEALSRSMELLSLPESKGDYEKVFQSIKQLFGNDEKWETLQQLTKTINSTFERLKPAEVMEAFANALEQLLKSTNRLTPKNKETLFNNFIDEIRTSAESLMSNDNPEAHINALGISIFSFLLNEDLAEFKNFETFMKNLEAEFQTLAEVSKNS